MSQATFQKLLFACLTAGALDVAIMFQWFAPHQEALTAVFMLFVGGIITLGGFSAFANACAIVLTTTVVAGIVGWQYTYPSVMASDWPALSPNMAFLAFLGAELLGLVLVVKALRPALERLGKWPW
ncbi:MAG: hypothetical protein PHT12_00285 [Patescibacteria group bacterium]|nr:hypothetical protein [Patescibacteria group bacterium]